jgi:hypothetical protein
VATPTVRFHTKVLEAPSTSLDTMIESMRQAYATQGIGVEHVSAAILEIPERDLFLDIDTGACAGSASVTDEQRALFTHGIADWSGWFNHGGQIQGAPTTVSRNSSVCNIYARGMDDALWQCAFWEGRWHDWGRLGGGLSAPPAAGTMGPDHEHVFVRGTDGAVWQIFWTQSAGWSQWFNLGGQIKGAPTTVSRDPSVCNVYARGMDDGLWQRAWWDNRWHDWTSLGGGLSAAPAADSMRPGHEHVFVRGTDGAVYHRFWTQDGGWSEWFNLGAPPPGFEGAPSTISRNPESCNVYVRSPDGALWQRPWFGGTWHGWARHDDGGRLSAEPAPGTMGPDHEHVFVRGLDGSVWSKWWFGAHRDRELVVFFVRTVTGNGGSLNGCAACPDDRPAAVVASYASTWTLAHEIGHVLDLNHLSGENCAMAGYQPTRLMTGCGTGRIVDPPAELDGGERSTVVSNPLIVQR